VSISVNGSTSNRAGVKPPLAKMRPTRSKNARPQSVSPGTTVWNRRLRLRVATYDDTPFHFSIIRWLTRASAVVVAESPFTVRRRVRWSDCDPAGVVFTGRFPEYLLGAVEQFMRHVMGADRASFVAGLGIDTPCKGLSLAFHVALKPEDTVDIVMRVGRIGEHSWDLEASALTPDGRVAFEGRFTPICILREPRGKVAIPGVLRERLERHTGVA